MCSSPLSDVGVARMLGVAARGLEERDLRQRARVDGGEEFLRRP